MAKLYKTKTKKESYERSGPFSKTTTTYTKESNNRNFSNPRKRSTSYTVREADVPEGHKKGVERKVEKTVTNNRGRTRTRLISQERAERQMKRKDRRYKPASPFSGKSIAEKRKGRPIKK